MQGYGGQQNQPFVTGRTRFLIGQDQRRQRHGAAADSPQLAGCQRNQQHQKEIQQIPLRQPRNIGTVGTAGMQQAPAGGQSQGHRQAIEVMLPADGRQVVRRTGDETVGAQRNHPTLDLDASLTLGILRDELILPFDIDPSQHRRSGHRQTPGTTDLARNAVADGQRRPVKTQPKPTLQRQFIRRRVAVAAADFLEAKHGIRAQQIARQALPLLRQRRLLRIDRWRAFDRRTANQGCRLKHPHLLVSHHPLGRRQLQCLYRPRMPRRKGDIPCPRPGLHLEAAVLCQHRRQWRIQRQRHKLRQQHATDGDLAPLARNF